MSNKDALVSTAAIRDALAELRAKQDEDAGYLPDYALKRGEWVIARMEKALRDAEREYVSLSDAARLKGWDEKTLRKWGRAALDGSSLPEEWGGILARFEGGRWSFCLATVPYNPHAAAA